jgi:hypothetical protein
VTDALTLRTGYNAPTVTSSDNAPTTTSHPPTPRRCRLGSAGPGLGATFDRQLCLRLHDFHTPTLECGTAPHVLCTPLKYGFDPQCVALKRVALHCTARPLHTLKVGARAVQHHRLPPGGLGCLTIRSGYDVTTRQAQAVVADPAGRRILYAEARGQVGAGRFALAAGGDGVGRPADDRVRPICGRCAARLLHFVPTHRSHKLAQMQSLQ